MPELPHPGRKLGHALKFPDEEKQGGRGVGEKGEPIVLDAQREVPE